MNPFVVFGLGYLAWALLVFVSLLVLRSSSPRFGDYGLVRLFVWVFFNSFMGIAGSVAMGFMTNHHPLPWAMAVFLGIPIWWFIFGFIRDTFSGR